MSRTAVKVPLEFKAVRYPMESHCLGLTEFTDIRKANFKVRLFHTALHREGRKHSWEHSSPPCSHRSGPAAQQEGCNLPFLISPHRAFLFSAVRACVLQKPCDCAEGGNILTQRMKEFF